MSIQTERFTLDKEKAIKLGDASMSRDPRLDNYGYWH
jgi:hypothetical protein